MSRSYQSFLWSVPCILFTQSGFSFTQCVCARCDAGVRALSHKSTSNAACSHKYIEGVLKAEIEVTWKRMMALINVVQRGAISSLLTRKIVSNTISNNFFIYKRDTKAQTHSVMSFVLYHQARNSQLSLFLHQP